MSRAYGYASYGGPETETWFDREIPTPGPSELVIETRAVGVNAVDHKKRAGYLANPEATPDFPLVLGSEASGVVVAVGSDVDGFAEGDVVMGRTAPDHGSYAEHAVLLAADTAKKPPQLSFVDAAALPVAGGTAWDVVEKARVSEGDTVLINGVGGGVGVLIAQLARNRGAAVFGVASESKRALTESIGAVLVPYDTGDVAEQVRALLPTVDVVVDTVGGDALKTLASFATDKSRVVSIVDPAAEELGGSLVYGTAAGVSKLAELVAEDKVDPKVLQTYPFDEAPEALRSVETGHVLGKIVIDIGQTTRS